MKKKYTIQVRHYENNDDIMHPEKFTLIETIQRVPWMESIGNFNPMFCRYHNKRTLVHSDMGDLSDPFRANKSYLKTLYIKI